ncbi:unnamed protein product [Echinostoma caproni]|uniref:Amiloride-sensitive sodium channel n=1 Tax=Echinostoma caproni TaxID=27848 RepID=A0A183A9X6_9TREM|nr:unnamed protein product [Echinostoma caproni]
MVLQLPSHTMCVGVHDGPEAKPERPTASNHHHHHHHHHHYQQQQQQQPEDDMLNTPTNSSTLTPGLVIDEEQPRFLTGWVPVVKIFTTKNRAVRALWAVFTVCMVVALVSSITVVVHRHLSYVTVIRLDERGPQDDLPPPAVTICLVEHELTHLNVNRLIRLGKHNWNIIHGTTKHCDEQNVVTWNSATDAVSPIYNHSAHILVTFATDPVVCFTLKVLEQVPAPPNSICTTFETMPRFPKNASFWKVVSSGFVECSHISLFWPCTGRKPQRYS